MFLLYYPLKQGLKHLIWSSIACPEEVFTLLSIKTRIETYFPLEMGALSLRFLLYYPLKQGLKHWVHADVRNVKRLFLLYYPLKQGLKQ